MPVSRNVSGHNKVAGAGRAAVHTCHPSAGLAGTAPSMEISTSHHWHTNDALLALDRCNRRRACRRAALLSAASKDVRMNKMKPSFQWSVAALIGLFVGAACSSEGPTGEIGEIGEVGQPL